MQIPWNKGLKGYHIHSEEWKKKQSEKYKGRKGFFKGKKHPQEWKDHMREIMTGREKITEEGREQLRLKRLGKNNPMYGKTHSDKYKLWLKINKSGENSNNWKGGITPENKLRLSNAEWAKTRLKVYKRDNFTCQRCGIKCTNSKKQSSTTIQCHHLEPWRDTKNDSLTNLVTLCVKCHGIVENERDENHFWEFKKK